MDFKLWWFALQKPVKENDKKVWDSFDVIAKWLISTRATVTQLTLMAGVIAGLLAAPTVWALFAQPAVPRIEAGPALLVVAGLLVGWGTRYGSGCTSGHGVCGLSRLSPRSLVATLAFMAAGFATVFVARHLLA